MPVTAYHQLTATTPDDPAYEIRPSHFNQSHLVTISAQGYEDLSLRVEQIRAEISAYEARKRREIDDDDDDFMMMAD